MVGAQGSETVLGGSLLNRLDVEYIIDIRID